MKKPFRFFKWTGKKAVTLLLVTVLLSLAVADVTLSLLFDRTEPLENVFEPAKVVLALTNEHLVEGGETGHRLIINKGEVPLFIRVFAVVSWESTADEHTILAEMPNVSSNLDKPENYDANADVLLTFYQSFSTSKWFQGADGFFYCTVPLGPGETLHMIESAVVQTKKDGYAIRVEMVAEGVQGDPVTVNGQTIHPVEQAWPAVKVVNGQLTPVESNPTGGNTTDDNTSGGNTSGDNTADENETTNEDNTNATP